MIFLFFYLAFLCPTGHMQEKLEKNLLKEIFLHFEKPVKRGFLHFEKLLQNYPEASILNIPRAEFVGLVNF